MPQDARLVHIILVQHTDTAEECVADTAFLAELEEETKAVKLVWQKAMILNKAKVKRVAKEIIEHGEGTVKHPKTGHEESIPNEPSSSSLI